MNTSVLAALAATLLLAASFAGAPSAAAGEARRPLGVVELFTSQGCSSCPPADKVLGDLARTGDVVALGYHVSYWDYLGWRDTLASPENTQRQYDYGKSFGIRSVYTPQAVINGRMHVNGANRSAVSGALDRMARDGEGMQVPIRSVRHGDSMLIEVGPAEGTEREGHLVLVYFDIARPVEITRGENKGATVIYWNAVTDVQTAGMWHGKAASFDLPASEITRKGGCAALLQAVDGKGLPGPILGATLISTPEAPSAK